MTCRYVMDNGRHRIDLNEQEFDARCVSLALRGYTCKLIYEVRSVFPCSASGAMLEGGFTHA